jgi:hypothetical protein
MSKSAVGANADDALNFAVEAVHEIELPSLRQHFILPFRVSKDQIGLPH